MERYPVLHLAVRYGNWIALIAALVTAIAVFGLTYAPLGWPAIPLAFVVAAFIGLLGLSYVELIRLIAEMLLPQ